MSQETREWLNTYTLQSRAVWHTDEALQAILDQPTVYDGEIPVEDVRSRLFGWEPLEAEITATGTPMDEDGVGEQVSITDRDRKAILRPPGALGPEDEGSILGVFKQGYQPHSYAKWLLENVGSILDDDLGIYSAGLLRKGAQAWVQVTVPETITTPEGVQFRPNLLAVTSFDGSLATTYKRTITNAVCDNTMAAALYGGPKDQQLKVRHSRYSHLKLTDARDALAIVHTIADDFAAEVAELSAVKVTPSAWDRFLNEVAPLEDKDGKTKEGRAATMAQNKQAELNRLWSHDARVTPWKGTAFGVVQAVNTHAHHVASVARVDRTERNMQRAVEGNFDKLDAETAETILAIAR